MVALHKLRSIGVGTSKGDSACFIREDSSHEAAELIVIKFLNFLDEVKEKYELMLPEYFQRAFEKIEEMISEESSLSKKKKMELEGLKRQLKQYLKLDIFGYNSAEVKNLFFFTLLGLNKKEICELITIKTLK